MSLVLQIARSIQLDVGIFDATYLSITSVAILMQRLLIKGSPWALINRRLQPAWCPVFFGLGGFFGGGGGECLGFFGFILPSENNFFAPSFSPMQSCHFRAAFLQREVLALQRDEHKTSCIHTENQG